MEINVSNNPEQQAGEYISSLLSKSDNNTLVLLSGGSATVLFDYIDESVLNPNHTFMMMDERFSDDTNVNNYLQFSHTNLYNKIQNRHAKIIESSFNTQEVSLEDAAVAMQKTLEYFFKVQEDCNVIALFGIGPDGHTASIFPKESEEEFSSIYRTNNLYISIVEETNPHPERLTITPYFVKKYVNEAVLFAVGEDKCSGVLPKLVSGDYKAYEMPAIIPANHPTAQLFTDCTSIVDSK